ncbi:MAG: RsmB/NOP family class I SAM-dependent RNA methyltransferase [Pseudomonadota bacterium]
MTPAARVQAAIGILDAWLADAGQLDRQLAAWGRQNRYAGSKDRHAIADLVWDAIRCRRSAAWAAGVDEDSATGRDLIRGRFLADGADPGDFFCGGRYGPAPLSASEQQPVRETATAPRAVRLDYPDWMEPHLANICDTSLEKLRGRASLDLRVNTLKASQDDAIASLAEEDIETEPVNGVPTALRVLTRPRGVRSSVAYRDGLVEIQDAASQAVAGMAACQPGETVLDLCCGGGGKTLAMAAMMKGEGRLIAHDINPERTRDLPDRAQRAGALVKLIASHDLDGLKGRCDVVVADVPCSGSGAWRRNPDARWMLSPEQLIRFGRTQREILKQALQLCAPNGRVLYATCSIIKAENEDVVDACLQDLGDWQLDEQASLSPGAPGDGFFGSLLRPSLTKARPFSRKD